MPSSPSSTLVSHVRHRFLLFAFTWSTAFFELALVPVLPNVGEDYSSKHSVTYKTILYACQTALHNLHSISCRKIGVASIETMIEGYISFTCTYYSMVRHSMQAPPCMVESDNCSCQVQETLQYCRVRNRATVLPNKRY